MCQSNKKTKQNKQFFVGNFKTEHSAHDKNDHGLVKLLTVSDCSAKLNKKLH